MKVFHHLSRRVRPETAGSVLAIGIFDGFHRGHQKIIKKVKAEASLKGVAAGVLSFSPHPEKALNGRPIKMIQTLEQRLRSFERAGLDFCLLFDLDNGLSRLSGEEFARQIIKDSLGIQQVVVGRNFRFGHQRQCGVDDLKKFGHLFGFKVTVLEPARSGGRPISSSLIRKLLESGRIEEANKLLGHPYEISGRVVSGDKLGQRLGFPTINLETENEITP
ncbi:MAG TPA: riboflavin kinase, partial [Candidatus Saccharicenans sp.]|nr:riboflavin kinase [Candidatus Saccharicenans sp.]